jgi:hypothetical protein
VEGTHLTTVFSDLKPLSRRNVEDSLCTSASTSQTNTLNCADLGPVFTDKPCNLLTISRHTGFYRLPNLLKIRAMPHLRLPNSLVQLWMLVHRRRLEERSSPSENGRDSRPLPEGASLVSGFQGLGVHVFPTHRASRAAFIASRPASACPSSCTRLSGCLVVWQTIVAAACCPCLAPTRLSLADLRKKMTGLIASF